MLQPYNPANADLIVNIDGRLVHRDEAGISPFDSSVHVRLTVSRGLKYTSGLDPRINTAGCSYFILAEHKARNSPWKPFRLLRIESSLSLPP